MPPEDVHDRLTEMTAEVHRLNRRLRQLHGQIDAELNLARRIQMSFLPQSLPQVSGARFAVHYSLCGRVGGDFYDLFRLFFRSDDNKLLSRFRKAGKTGNLHRVGGPCDIEILAKVVMHGLDAPIVLFKDKSVPFLRVYHVNAGVETFAGRLALVPGRRQLPDRGVFRVHAASTLDPQTVRR